MLFGRALSRGLAKDAPSLASRHVARLVRSSRPSSILVPAFAQSPTVSLSSHQLLNAILQRCYATAGRPKGSTTKKPSTSGTAARGRKRGGTGAKTAKSKAKPKSKAKAKKPAGRRRSTKKPLTDVQAKAKKVTALRKESLLTKPKMLPISAYQVLAVENAKKGSNATQSAKATSVQYRNLSTPEREHYNNIANQNKVVNERTYKTWIQSHTPDQIRIANNARRQLNKIAKEPKPPGRKSALVGHSFNMLKDERAVKRPDTPFVQFMKERWASGDFSGIRAAEVQKNIAHEWKSMSRQAAQKYHEGYESAKSQYRRDYDRIYSRRTVKAT